MNGQVLLGTIVRNGKSNEFTESIFANLLQQTVQHRRWDSMERRGQSRKNERFAVIIQGRDHVGNWFKQEVIANNVSRSGALLSGMTRQVRLGDLIWVECAGKKVRFKVVWMRDSASHNLIQAAVHLFDTEPCPWVEICE